MLYCYMLHKFWFYKLHIKYLELLLLLLFFQEVSYAHQKGIYLIENTVKTVILWNSITI